MNAQVEPIEYLGNPAIQLKTDELEAVVVPMWGSNLISLRRTRDQLEVLRTPNDVNEYYQHPMLYGMPVLFPPNRIENGTFQFAGRTYRFPLNRPESNSHIHGVLLHHHWQLHKAEAVGGLAIVETIADSDQIPALYNALPHSFTIILRYTMEKNMLKQEFIVHNRDHAPLPFGLGYHTAFRFPLSVAGSPNQCTFQIHVDKLWELDHNALPTGKLLEYPYKQQLAHGMPLTGIHLDDVLTTDRAYPNQAVITDGDAGIRVIYSCDDDFGIWVLHNAGKTGFLCPEPYTWVTNAPNLGMPDEVTGFRSIAPGETAIFTSKIVLETFSNK